MLRCMLSRPITIWWSLNLDQLLDGAVIRRLCLFLDLDIQHFRAPAVKTRRRARVCQCTFAAREHCRLVGLIRYFRESRLLTTGGFFFSQIRTGTCGKSPGVRPMPGPTWSAFRRAGSASRCASFSDRRFRERTSAWRSARSRWEGREVRDTDICCREYMPSKIQVCRDWQPFEAVGAA